MQSTLSHKDSKPLAEFGVTATKCIRQVRKTKRPLHITDQGRSAAVLLDIGASVALLQRKELVDDIAVAEQQLAAGQALAHEAAIACVLERLPT